MANTIGNSITQSTSRFLDVGVTSDLKITVWVTLLGVLVSFVIFLLLTRKINSGKVKAKTKTKTKLKSVLIVVFLVVLVVVAGFWFYSLLAPGLSQNKSTVALSGVKFPLTGQVQPPQILVRIAGNLFSTLADGLITSSLLLLVIVLGVAAFQNINIKKRINKDLENAKIMAESNLKDLQIEKARLAVIAKEKESARHELEVVAGELKLKAENLAVIAKEKESIKHELEVTAGELAEAKSKEEALLGSIGDGVVATDKNGKVILLNKVAENLLGLTSKEMMGKVFDNTIFMQNAEGVQIPDNLRPLTLALSSGKTATTTFYYKNKDGDPFPIVVTASPIIFSNNIIGAVEVIRDITKEKEVDKAKTEFISLASHQLRTPLSTVSWYSEMLLAGDAGKLSAKQKQYLDEVYKGNQRMVSLVNALLNVSRLELGTFTVEPAPTDVVKLAGGVVDELKLQIAQRQLQFKEQYGEKLPLLSADPKLLTMVFQNILSNAVKYTPDKGSVSIDLRLVKRGESVNKQKMDEDSIVIIVSDNGFGIPKNQQEKIFTKFFRADNVREKDTEGTGLGLYIVKSVIDNAGGKIWFESEENKGTTFYVILPLVGMKKKEGTKTLA